MTDRMFCAVLLPDDVRQTLDAIIDPRRDDEWRWTRPESWHITLAFYAAVEDWRHESLTERLEAAAALTPSFPLGIEGVRAFPSAKPHRAKVLYAAVDDPTDSLPGLNRRCVTAASTSGIEGSGDRYVPHLTLARAGPAKDATRWLRALVGAYAPQWQVTDIALVQSHLGEGRPRYEVRERFTLGRDLPGLPHRPDADKTGHRG